MGGTTPSDDAGVWHRKFAIDCNNRAWELSELTSRTAEEDDELLSIAHASVWHWSKVGTPHNIALGQTLLGQVHALLGHGDPAMRFARAAYDYVTSQDSDAWEVAFAHAVLAHAAAVGKDVDTHHFHYEKAKALGESLGKEDREIFNATFRLIPAPAGHKSRP